MGRTVRVAKCVHRIWEQTAAGREEDAAVGQCGFQELLVRAPEALMAASLVVRRRRHRRGGRVSGGRGGGRGRERDRTASDGPGSGRAEFRVPSQRHKLHEAGAAVHRV